MNVIKMDKKLALIKKANKHLDIVEREIKNLFDAVRVQKQQQTTRQAA